MARLYEAARDVAGDFLAAVGTSIYLLGFFLPARLLRRDLHRAGQAGLLGGCRPIRRPRRAAAQLRWPGLAPSRQAIQSRPGLSPAPAGFPPCSGDTRTARWNQPSTVRLPRASGPQ